MGSVHKVLGQVVPSTNTLTALYTVPGSTSAVVSTIVACNTGTVPTTIGVQVRVAGAASNVKQYIIPATFPVPGNNAHVMTIGITLAATDVVYVTSGNGLVSFNLFGTEIT